MGVRNATVRKIGVQDLTTTVLTQTITGLAADSSLAGGSNARWQRQFFSVVFMFAGAAAGAVSAKFADAGIDDAFMKRLGETLTPGSSALFVVARKTKPELLLERLKPFAGRCTILQSTMTAENEGLLRDALGAELSRLQTSAAEPAVVKSP